MSASRRNNDAAAASGEPLDRESAEVMARTLRAVADPTRLQLLSMIAASPTGEATAGEMAVALGLRQPTVSHHVKIMVDDGLLQRDQRGRHVWLSIVENRKESIMDLLR